MNAIQSMPRGGKLEISTGQENEELFVRFKDTGIGISPEDMERIFDPFFTTKVEGHGTGLGLAVCRTLVNQHHGDITVKTEPGKGSTFTVWLPPAEVKEAMLAR
jgi:signal transduction histidine kinase